MITKYNIFVLIALVCTSTIFALSARAQDLEESKFAGSRNNEITLWGSFNKSKVVWPEQTIFGYMDTSKDKRTASHFRYVFAGRTGEKTFELKQIERHFNEREEKNISIYFDAVTPLPLWPMSVELQVSAGCADDEVPKIKMIKLIGNELETQVILPNCLKK